MHFNRFCSPIVHPLIDPRTTPVCLITKDPQREYKDLIASHNIKFISRVVGIEKLKGKFKPFEARRMLLQENGMFLADERVVPLLPKLLGRKFFEAKKCVLLFMRAVSVLTYPRQPIPVNLTRKDLKGELERAISSTYMHQNNGTCRYAPDIFPYHTLLYHSSHIVDSPAPSKLAHSPKHPLRFSPILHLRCLRS